MHEFSVADAIVERALEAATEHDATTIEKLTIEVGMATHINPAQLQTCLETLTRETPAAGATVAIERVEPATECSCGWAGEPPTLDGMGAIAPNLRCPDCGGRTELTRGKECRLTNITVPED